MIHKEQGGIKVKFEKELSDALTSAVIRRTAGLREVGVLFSAGLDSSLIAKICEEIGKKVLLYSAAMRDSSDFEYIKKAEGYFAKIKFKEIDFDAIESYVKKVVGVIEGCNPMDVGIGIPTYIACEMAKKDGIKVVLSGQGADECFAGYYRYLRMREKELREALLRDVQSINLKRDHAIASANLLELKFPYLDERVTSIAANIPVNLKIKGGVRKYILRQVAKKKALPEFVVNREKKAIQYSTGVDKALRKLAKRKNKTLEEYLNNIFGR